VLGGVLVGDARLRAVGWASQRPAGVQACSQGACMWRQVLLRGSRYPLGTAAPLAGRRGSRV
jgi:hypothetical protein